MADSGENSLAGDDESEDHFVTKLYRDWRTTQHPESVMTCSSPDDVCIVGDVDLNCRSNSCNPTFEWTFLVSGSGKQLKHIALGIRKTNYFVIRSVCKSGKKTGRTTDFEWHNTEDHVETEKESETNISELPYIVTVGFSGEKYGTYRQDIIFAFDGYPVTLRRLCMDCSTDADMQRIASATEFQLSQNPSRWTEKTVTICPFKSPLIQLRDAREEGLSKIYPIPDKKSFFLTQETLNDDRLTRENYTGRLHELIATEELARQEQISRYNETARVRLLSHYIVESVGDSATVAKYAYPGELFAQLPLSRHIVEDTRSGRLFLRSCNAVLIRVLGTPNLSKPLAFEAQIEDKCTQSVYIRLPKDCVDTLNLVPDVDLQVKVQFVLARMPFCEWHRAVDCLPDVELVVLDENMVEVQNDFNEDMRMDVERLVSDNVDDVVINLMLNSGQRRAVNLITIPIAIRLPPILVLGPFGTGKTFTIAQALRMLLIDNPKHKILLCTHSNSAADLYVREYFDVWYKVGELARLKPIRIYYKGRARNTVHPIVQKYTLMDANGMFRDPTESDLIDSGLIITTLSTASTLMGFDFSPTHIIIDEAAQALECEILIPLSLATRDTRLVLAGDQMQLAPEIYSDLANECGLGTSMLERLHKMYPESHLCRVHLCLSYRAHPDIIQFTSEMFYGGLVRPCDKTMFSHPTLKPLTFFAVSGQEVQGMYSTGYIHMSEASELARRVFELKKAWPVESWGPYTEGSIGVLAYYAEQVQMIRRELRKRGLYDVSAERVLNVQGKQFTAVFISIVRTRNGCRQLYETNVKDYGFLTNPRLLNTAITRAKCLVAVVGDPLGLLTIGSCRKMWQRYIQTASLYGISHEGLKYQLSLIPDPPPPAPLNPLAREFVPRQQNQHIVEYVPVPILYPVLHHRRRNIFG